jgi:outer membrane lipoprotein carrier protein
MLKSLTFLTFLALAPVTAFAEAPEAPAAPSPVEDVSVVLGKIQGKYKDVDLVRATFQQSSTSALYGGAEQTGTLTVQRPRKMRWDFDGDGKQFVSNGKTMWVYSANDKQVVRYTDFGSQAASTDAILQSLDKLGELFDVTRLQGEGVVLGLVPKDSAGAAQVKRIELALSDGLDLRRVQVTDAYDGVTTLTFNKVELGGTVPASTFEFQVPDGVEVVDVSG